MNAYTFDWDRFNKEMHLLAACSAASSATSVQDEIAIYELLLATLRIASRMQNRYLRNRIMEALSYCKTPEIRSNPKPSYTIEELRACCRPGKKEQKRMEYGGPE